MGFANHNRRRAATLVRLSEIDLIGLVPWVKKMTRLVKCDPKPTYFLQTAAKSGGLREMGSLGAGRRLAC